MNSFRKPFNIFVSGGKKSAISKTSEREFEREIRKLDLLEENTKKVHKDMKRCTESQSAQMKSESDIIQNLQSSLLYKEDEKLHDLVDQWSQATRKLELLMEELNATSNKAVTEPIRKFGTIFPAVQQAIKKREQTLQEYNKCCERLDKYSKRERTGPNVIKLEQSRQAYAAAKLAFDAQNDALMSEVPKLYEGRITYFQPSLQALIKAQMKYFTDSQAVYSDLCRHFSTPSSGPPRTSTSSLGSPWSMTHDVATSDTPSDNSTAELKQSIQQRLAEIRALSITASDQGV